MDDTNENKDDSLFQDKHKVPPTDLKLVKNTVDQLDIILTILNNDEFKPYSISVIKHYVTLQKLKISDKDLQLTVDKLCDDKHVLLIENFDGRSPVQKYQDIPVADKSYRITYSGRFFLNSVSKKYSNRPYKSSIGIQRTKQLWAKAKTAAAISNSIIIIIIAIWGVYVADKTNRLEDQLKKNELINRNQIDSLTRMLNDTTRLKK